MSYDRFLYSLESRLKKVYSGKNLKPDELYEPQRYILSLGGKKLRPLLSLIAADLFDANINKAMPSAIGVELFHNFSLIHDDILDKAPLRRGKQTVHKKWNSDIAILSGDAMLVRAYIEIAKADATFRNRILDLFSKTAIEVCEGQQEDMNFENQKDVSVLQYTKMITKKTAVLLACSLKMGAISGNANENDANTLYNCGKHLGIAFQLKDDILDVFADRKKFGKQVGGDIISNKKTFLLLKAIELADKKQSKDLSIWIEKKKFNKKEKIISIIKIFNEIGIKDICEKEIKKHFNFAISSLDKIKAANPEKKDKFKIFCTELMQREK